MNVPTVHSFNVDNQRFFSIVSSGVPDSFHGCYWHLYSLEGKLLTSGYSKGWDQDGAGSAISAQRLAKRAAARIARRQKTPVSTQNGNASPAGLYAYLPSTQEHAQLHQDVAGVSLDVAVQRAFTRMCADLEHKHAPVFAHLFYRAADTDPWVFLGAARNLLDLSVVVAAVVEKAHAVEKTPVDLGGATP
jgi:hypothetical protein